MAEPGSIPTLLQDLDALNPVDQAKVSYGSLQQHPDWARLSDGQKDQLFHQYQPGVPAQLTGSDLSAARRVYEGQQADQTTARAGPPAAPPGSPAVAPPWLTTGLGGPGSVTDVPPTTTNMGTVGQDIAQAVPGATRWTLGNVALPAAAARSGQLAGAEIGSAFGPVGTVVGGIGGGMIGAGGAEYVRQNVEQEPRDWGKVALAAGTQGVVGPVIGLAKSIRYGVPAVLARTPGKVAAAEQAAAPEVRAAVTAAVPRQGNVSQLFSNFEQALANSPNATIPAPQLARGLEQTATSFSPTSTVSTIQKLNKAKDELKAVLTPTVRVGPGGMGPVEQKIKIADAYQKLRETWDETLSMPRGSTARSELEHLRGLINDDLDAYAATPNANPAAGLLRDANQASRADRAVDRVREIVDGIMPTPEVGYGPKQATALAKALRTDKALGKLLNDPSERDALVNAATEIGGRTPQPLPKAGGMLPGAGTLLGGAAGTAADVVLGGGGVIGGMVGGALGFGAGEAGDVLRRITPVMLQAAKDKTTNPRSYLVMAALLHSARGGLQAAREQELARMRQPGPWAAPP